MSRDYSYRDKKRSACHTRHREHWPTEIPCWESRLRVGRIVRAAGFKDPECEMNQFTHGGADNHHRWFARCAHAESQRTERRIAPERREGREVQRLAKTAGAKLDQAPP